MLDKDHLSQMGKLGAIKFWQRFHGDPDFRHEMLESWKKQRYNRNQKRSAAKKGAAALWSRYHSDPAFKVALDQKLKASRSRGGARLLLSISEGDFKRRLSTSEATRSRPVYHDANGNRLRSRLKTRVAQALQDNRISYTVEPRILVPGHAFYPDFMLAEGRKIIEVIGYAADWYWDRTAEKVKLIIKNHGHIQVGIVTPFLRIMTRRLERVPRIAFFTPYQLEQLTQWCRGMPGFTTL